MAFISSVFSSEVMTVVEDEVSLSEAFVVSGVEEAVVVDEAEPAVVVLVVEVPDEQAQRPKHMAMATLDPITFLYRIIKNTSCMMI